MKSLKEQVIQLLKEKRFLSPYCAERRMRELSQAHFSGLVKITAWHGVQGSKVKLYILNPKLADFRIAKDDEGLWFIMARSYIIKEDLPTKKACITWIEESILKKNPRP